MKLIKSDAVHLTCSISEAHDICAGLDRLAEYAANLADMNEAHVPWYESIVNMIKELEKEGIDGSDS